MAVSTDVTSGTQQAASGRALNCRRPRTWYGALFALLALLFFTALHPAMAQAPGWTDSGLPDTTSGSTTGELVNPQEAEIDASVPLLAIYNSLASVFKNASVSTATGMNTILALYTLGIAIGGLRVAGGLDLVQAVVEWVKFSLLATFAVACITKMSWAQAITGTDGTVGEMLREAFLSMGDKGFGGEAGSGAIKAAGSFMDVCFKLLDIQIVPQSAETWYAKLGWMLMHPLVSLIAALNMFLTVVSMSVAGALIVGEVFFAMLSMDLAIAFAPLLVPWVMFRPMSFLFDAWLRTILLGGMTYVLSSMLARGAGAFATKMVEISRTTFPPDATYSLKSVAAVYGTMFLASMVFIFIAMRVSSLGRTLISGSGVGGIGIGDFRMGIGGVGSVARPGQGAAGMSGRAASAAAGAGGRLANSRMSPAAQARMAKVGAMMRSASNTARFIATGRRTK